jgi:hypothetical protein
MIPYSQSIRNDGQSWIHCPTGTEEAAINDIEIVNVMGSTIQIQHRRCGIFSKSAGAHLMPNSLQGQLPRVSFACAHKIRTVRHDFLTAFN